MMLREALARWVAPAVTGSVTLELRRGDDWTVLGTKAQYMSYAPEKLSMERVEEPAFTPEDRIGALELQNLSVGDNRSFLLHHLEAIRALGAKPGGPGLGALLGSGDDE
jgi:argininosuccinate synthase